MDTMELVWIRNGGKGRGWEGWEGKDGMELRWKKRLRDKNVFG